MFARDGKPYSLEIPHTNIPDYDSVSQLLEICGQKLYLYEEKAKKKPETLVFDSVSRIFTDIEENCLNKFKNFAVWENINKEISSFNEAINAMLSEGYNVVLVTHAMWDAEAKKYIETCKGSFAKIGGFVSTVDYAINIDILGNKRIITHRNSNLARTLLDDVPEKEDANDFNLQAYLDKIAARSKSITDKWCI